jgi:hypothetical protein
MNGEIMKQKMGLDTVTLVLGILAILFTIGNIVYHRMIIWTVIK